MKITFKTKGIDSINIVNILLNNLVCTSVPSYPGNIEVPIMSYKYTNPIRNNIINYNDTISNLDQTEYENWIPTCNCDKSKYCFAPREHVITGDLTIITNEKLRSLVSKGPKYKE